MEKNIRNSKFKFLFRILFIFTLLFVVFLAIQNKAEISLVKADSEGAEETTATEPLYLSDIPERREDGTPILLRKNVGYGSFNNNATVSVKIEGAFYSFNKGIYAHATSDIIYDITDYSNNYDYFTAYLGLNNTSNAGNGVTYQIYVSNDGTFKTWEISEYGNIKKLPSENATHVKIPIKNFKYLRLVANADGSNGHDHSVYADAKLVKEGYKEPGEEDVPTITDLDTLLKNVNINENTDITEYIKQHPDYELALLQRTFIKKTGPYALRRFIAENEKNKKTLNWLMYNSELGKDDTTERDKAENLRLYLLGGAPDGGNYYNSLTQLSRLYDEYSNDFTNNTAIENDLCADNMTRGDLYRKMAITLSLTHTQTVGLWMQSGAAENKSDALKRYAIYKYMYENGRLNVLGGTWNVTKWFETLNVEEMRFIMNNNVDDEEILWLNTYVQDRLNQYGQSKYITPHPYIAYIWPNYQDSRYYAEENVDYFNKLFAVNKTNDNKGTELTGEYAGKVGLFDTEFTIPGGKNNQTYTFKVTRGTPNYKLYKVWMNFRNKFGTGCVCGGISKSGSNIRGTHGIPATVIGQPGHAALLYYTQNMDPNSVYYGKGYWNIDNDVSGWTLSEKGERMLLGWGNNRSFATGYTVVYMQLAQEALNDYENFEKAEETIMLADVYNGNLENQEEVYEKQELIYRKALEKQAINIDAWYNLIMLYNANKSKTENEFCALAEELAESLKDFPLPMYQLTNLIKPHLTSVQNTYKFTLLQTNTLKEASTLPNSVTRVCQPSLTRLEANHLLGKVDKSIATFSFDGANAGKLVFASKFDGNGFRFEYSLTVDEDGNRIWKTNNSFTAEEEHKWQLTETEIASITSANDIYINIEGVPRNDDTIFQIDITEQALPVNLFANDLENRVIGVNLNTEWRYTEKDQWISYSTASPDLTGTKTVQVRQPASRNKTYKSCISCI